MREVIVASLDDAPSMLVLFCLELKFGKGLGRSVADRVCASACARALVVCTATPTRGAATVLAENCGEKRVELFQAQWLTFDLLRHTLVPRHRVLAQHEAQELLERVQADQTQLPRIKTSDPVVRWLDVPKDTILEITRNPDTPDAVVTYRIVV